MAALKACGLVVTPTRPRGIIRVYSGNQCGLEARTRTLGAAAAFADVGYLSNIGIDRMHGGRVKWPSQVGRTRKQRNFRPVVVRAAYRIPQNVDMPLVLPKKKKKRKVSHNGATKTSYTKRLLQPVLREPANGLLVQHLIPVAHDVLEAKQILTKGVVILLEASTVWACRFCGEAHVGVIGHALLTCQGPRNDQRHSQHRWLKATIDDILVPVEAFHLADRLALPIAHDERFKVERISAIDELCIQAGVDIPEYPTRRYSDPIQSALTDRLGNASWMGDEYAHLLKQQERSESTESSAHENLEVTSLTGAEDALEGQVENGFEDHDVTGETLLESGDDCSREKKRIIPLTNLTSEDDLKTVAEKTLQAWERMRAGAKKLKLKYRVRVCGYCPEVHVGPKGHRAQVCGAFKHQWRNGQHGWQSASVDDLIPPQYVWHIRDRNEPQLHQALKRFYGKAPAVVELCVQAGASVPDCHKPLMRLDIVIPNIEEMEYVI